jgi:hypothetical protein
LKKTHGWAEVGSDAIVTYNWKRSDKTVNLIAAYAEVGCIYWEMMQKSVDAVKQRKQKKKKIFSN